MIKGFYVGTTGVIEHQKMLDVAANNLANANTNGYKSSRLTFQELLYSRARMPENYEDNKEYYDNAILHNKDMAKYGKEQTQGSRDTEADENILSDNYISENKLRLGAGGRGAELALNMNQGSFSETGDFLNTVIEGNAFFAVQGMNGDIYYSRNGDFRISEEEDGMYLTSQSGEYILDPNYNRILLPDDHDKTVFLANENVLGANEVPIGLFSCNNIYGLSLMGTNKYSPTIFSGAMEKVTDGTGVNLRQRFTEMSNVDIAQEMVRMIQAQRAFQTNLTVIRTADEIEAYTNQLRG